jgi:hypothetical protein
VGPPGLSGFSAWWGDRIGSNKLHFSSHQSLSLPVNNHSIVFPDVRAKRRRTAARFRCFPARMLALFVMTQIDEIPAWEQRSETERGTRFVELGRY